MHTGRRQLGKTHTKLPGRLSVFVGLHDPLLFPLYLLVLRTKAFPQLQIKIRGTVVVVEQVRPLAERRDQQTEKAEEHGE